MKKVLLIILCACFLAGCVTKNNTDQLDIDWRSILKFPEHEVLNNNVELGRVTGSAVGRYYKIPAFSKEQLSIALKSSLSSVNLLATDPENAGYVLDTEIRRIDRPFINVDTTVNTFIHYTLVDKSKQSIVYEKIVESPYRVSFEDSLLPVLRNSNAVAVSVSRNIHEMIEDLYLVEYGEKKNRRDTLMFTESPLDSKESSDSYQSFENKPREVKHLNLRAPKLDKNGNPIKSLDKSPNQKPIL